MNSKDLNKLFHSLADEGKLTAKIPGVEVDIIERINVLKEQIKNRKSIEWQRKELLKELARYWGLGEDDRFIDFMNS